MSEVTQILARAQQGDPTAPEELLPLVYAELRRLAAHRMACEAPGNTLQPTALVHEAWLRLTGSDNRRFAGRAHFFAAAAEAMRRILIDRARRKRSARHGGGQSLVPRGDLELAASASDDDLLDITEALERLGARDPQKAEFVKLRYFVGLKLEEAAELLGISVPTASRWWAYSRAWLCREIERQRNGSCG